jgi:hypothetical protein
VRVQVLDENNQLDTSSTARLPWPSATLRSGMLQGTITAAAVGGVATFRDLFLFGGQPAAGYTLLASSGNPTRQSQCVRRQSGAVSLQFLGQPANVAAGASLGPVTVASSRATAAWTPATTDQHHRLPQQQPGQRHPPRDHQRVTNGVATFAGLSLNKIGVGYTLGAQVTDIQGTDDPLLHRATSASFSIRAAVASGLAFGIQPGYNAVNQPLNGTNEPAGVTVRVVDEFGNLVSDSTASISVALNDNPGNATLSGTATVAAVNGVATFSTLKIDKAATGYSLEAHLTDDPAESVVSGKFNVGAQAPETMTFANLSAVPVGLDTVVPTFQVEVRGGDGQILSSDSTPRVTLSISNDNVAGGWLVGTLTATAVNGIATFSDLIFKGGPFRPRWSPARSPRSTNGSRRRCRQHEYDVRALGHHQGQHGAAVGLAFADTAMTDAEAGSPLKTVRLRVVDAQGNVVDDGPDSTATVLLAVQQAEPNLKATFLYDLNLEPDPSKAAPSLYIARAAVAGVATFANITINRVSVNYQLTASSQTFVVNGAPLTSLFAVKVGSTSQLATPASRSTRLRTRPSTATSAFRCSIASAIW